MKGYRDYMDRQQVSPALHDKLLALEQREVQHKPQPLKRWKPVLAMAACLCLVLGVCWGWSALSPAAHSAASTAEYAMDDAAVWEETAAAQEAADEAIPETTAAASTADEAEAEESAFTEEAAEDAAAKAALTPPEDALLPGWLPGGYALTQAEQDASGCCRLTWSDGDKEITLEYAYAGQPPEELTWPVYDREAADWETVSQTEARDGVWGFCLYDKDLACWQRFTTTGDHETLWDVAQSMIR